MNVTELMIGDWVYDTILQSNAKVQAIKPLTIRCDIHTEHHLYCEFNPIPLTPEILEKNGFYYRNTQGYYAQWYYKRFGSYVCFDIAISLVYREIEVSKVCGAGTDCEEEEYGSSIVFSNDICVHTLQHALRLCGLDELADNFKI